MGWPVFTLQAGTLCYPEKVPTVVNTQCHPARGFVGSICRDRQGQRTGLRPLGFSLSPDGGEVRCDGQASLASHADVTWL